jgi:hypothetical protein
LRSSRWRCVLRRRWRAGQSGLGRESHHQGDPQGHTYKCTTSKASVSHNLIFDTDPSANQVLLERLAQPVARPIELVGNPHRDCHASLGTQWSASYFGQQCTRRKFYQESEAHRLSFFVKSRIAFSHRTDFFAKTLFWPAVRYPCWDALIGTNTHWSH